MDVRRHLASIADAARAFESFERSRRSSRLIPVARRTRRAISAVSILGGRIPGPSSLLRANASSKRTLWVRYFRYGASILANLASRDDGFDNAVSSITWTPQTPRCRVSISRNSVCVGGFETTRWYVPEPAGQSVIFTTAVATYSTGTIWKRASGFPESESLETRPRAQQRSKSGQIRETNWRAFRLR